MASQRVHHEDLEQCPFLPMPDRVMLASAMKEVKGAGGPAVYERALLCAQSLWLQGYPAQSLLMINRALGVGLEGSEVILREWPLPYEAAAWVMRHREEDQFIGNPRRHYQHLATRMVEPRKELRSWRAWACWRLACLVFPEYPADEEQIAEEGIREPGREDIVERLAALGIAGEVGVWVRAEGLCGC